MCARPLPSAERLWALFDYRPLTGELVWRTSRPGLKAGSVAGYVGKRGYRTNCVDGRSYLAHRIIFKWVKGTDPKGVVHHKDSDPSNNRIWNLEDFDNRANCSIEKTEKSGLPVGVTLVGGRYYQARIFADGTRRHLGNYNTPEEASEAYQKALAEVKAGLPISYKPRKESSCYKYVSWHKDDQRWHAKYCHPTTKKSVFVGCFTDEFTAYKEALAHRLESHWI